MSTTRIARRHRIETADYCPGESILLTRITDSTAGWLTGRASVACIDIIIFSPPSIAIAALD